MFPWDFLRSKSEVITELFKMKVIISLYNKED
jgi:hypothetical protein